MCQIGVYHKFFYLILHHQDCTEPIVADTPAPQDQAAHTPRCYTFERKDQIHISRFYVTLQWSPLRKIHCVPNIRQISMIEALSTARCTNLQASVTEIWSKTQKDWWLQNHQDSALEFDLLMAALATACLDAQNNLLQLCYVHTSNSECRTVTATAFGASMPAERPNWPKSAVVLVHC